MRTETTVSAGSLVYETERLVTGWHHHDLHQLKCPLEGVAEVETAGGRYLIPSQQAIWIPAGVEHNTTLRGVRTASVFFDPAMMPAEARDRVRILPASPVLREMIVYALRWPIARTATDERADAYFSALAVVVEDGLDDAQPLLLPASDDPLVAAIIAYTEDHLATVTADDVHTALNISERTLRRRFRDATGTTWRSFVVRARLTRAMAELARPGATVIDVAASVGFGSPSSFNRAFRAFTGHTPADYRRRALNRSTAGPPPAPTAPAQRP
ncbi:helix-turn-helix transcriptional regulator [Yinghuangia sp. ASG 101]|uniref:AraC family transcriptional regulator n=1 Tax=Yinghuangia sp. ASG 101 TaxID=2896848 RepID=UPI001E60B6AF|nr:helix-turn-helix transcriptional regulator [Yinghuangia sp. ASG 101]UGQ12255.1 helix-turn-helix transcriptional regulator [Yinghuangia sp. ASG 101]